MVSNPFSQKKVTKHLTDKEALEKEGKRYVDVVQDMYSSPEVKDYLPLPSELVGEPPSVGDTSGIILAQSQGKQEGPPEIVAYIPLGPDSVGTAGKRMVPVKAPTENAYEFGRFISGAYRAYLSEGRLVPQTISRLSGLPMEKVGYYLRQEETTHALAIRGVSTDIHLTPEQDYALSILTDTSSNASWNARMRKAGLSNAKLLAWRQNPTFDQALKGMAEQITQNHDVALIELGRLVGDGNQRAIEKSLEISGRYNPAQQSTVDAIALVNRVTEILAEHLSDQPDLLKAVAKDLAALQHGNRVIEHQNNQSIFGLG